MNKLQQAGILVGVAVLAAGVLGGSTPVGAQHAAIASPWRFAPIVNPNDLTFTQVLGINNHDEIAGYYGSGATGHPNKGFTQLGLSPFVPENFPMSVQTQVIGLNNQGATDGFYIDSAGTTRGFTDINGTFSSVVFPGTNFNQLLGINNNGDQAGYFQFGKKQIFVPYIHLASGHFVQLPIFNAQATGINDSDLVSGFFNRGGVSHGFLWQNGHERTVDYPSSSATQILGVNNEGMAVGTYNDSLGGTHGFLYNVNTGNFTTVDAPFASSTVVNGINDNGEMVGFYTEGNDTLGFFAVPVPSI